MHTLLQSRLEEMKARSLSGELSVSDRQFIDQYYERVTFRTFTRRNCGRCYNDAFIEMYTTFKKHGLREMPNFRLKRGVVLQSAHFSGVISNANLTDEIAIQWLRDNPNRSNLFELLPEGWETEIAATPSHADEQMPVEQKKKSKKSKSAKA